MGKKGFTLIELAIVLTIIGLMVGGSFKMMKMMRERQKTQEAKEQVIAAKNAVIGYALEYIDLPTTIYFDANLSPSQDNNHPIFYAVDSSLSKGDDVCSYKNDDLSLVLETPDENITVAFIIAHEGANYNLQTGYISSTRVKTLSAGQKGDLNTTYMNNTNHEFDDIVEWVTLTQLQKEIGCINKPFRFINDKLPNALQYRDYNATLYVENNISEATINCSPSDDHNISFNEPKFSGIPQESGVAKFKCNADVNDSKQFVEKEFTITIDPNLKDYNATCANNNECQSGLCIGGVCQAGVVDNNCSINSDCQSGFCAFGVCTTGAFDVACDDGGDCRSGICLSGYCSGFLGDDCTSNTHCLNGYCDSNTSKCAIPPSSSGSGGSSGGGCTTNGLSCTKNANCCSNHCNNVTDLCEDNQNK